MSAWLDWLLGLDRLRLSDAGVEWGFVHRVPGWAWAFGAVVLAGYAFWSYRHLDGPRPARIALGTTRWLVIMLLAFLAAGPQLIRVNERTEPDWIFVLADRSRSLTIPDAPLSGGAHPREDQLQQDARAVAKGLIADNARNPETPRKVQWLGFDGGLFELRAQGQPDAETSAGDAPAALPALGEPIGDQTAIARSIAAALDKAAARPIAGIVLLSDGRSIDQPERALLARLKADQVPVLVRPLGSREPVQDLSIVSVEAPAMAFVNDLVPVTVELQRSQQADGESTLPPEGVIELIDRATGQVLESQPIPQDPSRWREGRTSVSLIVNPRVPDRVTWIARVRPTGPDLIADNNEGSTALELVDRSLRVLFIDGTPRWEYRYLKNLILREATIDSVSMLLAPNRQFIQESSGTTISLPRTPEDWARFDAIVIGDVTPEVFDESQLRALKAQVASKGVGLLWIGGPAATPTAWRDSPLADLLPFTLSLGEAIEPWNVGVLLAPTPAARGLGLLMLADDPREGWPVMLGDANLGWPVLHFAQRIPQPALKPAVETLATFTHAGAAGTTDPETSPALLSMRYGAGRVMYLATDEIWRWRFARGEALPERFWLPILRLLGRESLVRAARPAQLEATPRRAPVLSPVRLTLRLTDQATIDAIPQANKGIAVKIARRRDAASSGASGIQAGAIDLRLLPQDETAPGDEDRGGSSQFSASFLPDEPGTYDAVVSDAALAGVSAATDFEVVAAEDELHHPQTDHPLLETLATETGGRVLTDADLENISELLPRRDLRVATTPEVQPLWDRPLMLVLLVLLLTLEWIGRRVIKLT